MKKLLEIFQEINTTLILIDKATILYRKQNHHKGLLVTAEISLKLNNIIPKLFMNKGFFNKDYIVVDTDSIIQMLNNMLEAQVNSDYVLLGDIYELQLIPFLNTIQDVYKDGYNIKLGYWNKNISALKEKNVRLFDLVIKDTNIDKVKYSIEDTRVGIKTVKITTEVNSFYLHSNNNPFKEADIFIEDNVKKGITEYLVYGFGFGYHVRALLEKDINNVVIVFESDLHVLTLAFENCDLNDVLNSDRLTIVYDPKFNELRQTLDKDNVFLLIHYPSLMNIVNKDIKERLEEYFLFYGASRNQEDLLCRNFKKNIVRRTLYIDELKTRLRDKKLIIVAGGPSLDNEIENLRNISNEFIVLAVGRVVKKLLNVGITPDFFIIIDANEIVLEQMKDVEVDSIPLLYLPTVYYEVLEKHRGDQYLILQEGYPMAEEFAKKKNKELYKTGGSVSTTAIEIGIRLGCKWIICVGLDLAFVNNQTHAFDTGGKSIYGTESLRKVEGTDGTVLYTSKSLDSFRHWIERRIKEERNTRFINTSRGAMIQGMELGNLKDLVVF